MGIMVYIPYLWGNAGFISLTVPAGYKGLRSTKRSEVDFKDPKP